MFSRYPTGAQEEMEEGSPDSSQLRWGNPEIIAGRAPHDADQWLSMATPATDESIPEEPAAQSSVVPPPKSTLDFLERLMSDADKTNNARELIKSGAKAASQVIFSVGVVLCVIIILATLAIHYGSMTIAAGGVAATAATTSVAGLIWTACRQWRRRKARLEPLVKPEPSSKPEPLDRGKP